MLDLVQGIFQKGSTFLWGHKEIINKLQILNHCSKDFQSRIVAFRLNKTVNLVPRAFSLKKWVGREKALASAGHVSPRTP